VPEHFFLLSAQIILYVFAIHGKQPELAALNPVVVDETQPAALAFLPGRVGKASLAQPSRSLNHIASIGMFQKQALKLKKFLIVKILLTMALKKG